MDCVEATEGFAAMGSESRLAVLQCLVKAGGDGLAVGEIGERTGIAASTLAHHIKFLAAANLIVQERHGRSILCRANYSHLEALAGFILDACCVDQSAVGPARAQAGGASHAA